MSTEPAGGRSARTHAATAPATSSRPGLTNGPRRRAYRPVSVPAPPLTAANQVRAVTVAWDGEPPRVRNGAVGPKYGTAAEVPSTMAAPIATTLAPSMTREKTRNMKSHATGANPLYGVSGAEFTERSRGGRVQAQRVPMAEVD